MSFSLRVVFFVCVPRVVCVPFVAPIGLVKSPCVFGVNASFSCRFAMDVNCFLFVFSVLFVGKSFGSCLACEFRDSLLVIVVVVVLCFQRF